MFASPPEQPLSGGFSFVRRGKRSHPGVMQQKRGPENLEGRGAEGLLWAGRSKASARIQSMPALLAEQAGEHSAGPARPLTVP